MSVAWEEQGSCRQIGPALFEPPNYIKKDVAQAKAVCAKCPVRKPCLAAALDDEAGQPPRLRETVRGGLTPRERADLDHNRRKEAA